jgi:hypothetical protein
MEVVAVQINLDGLTHVPTPFLVLRVVFL